MISTRRDLYLILISYSNQKEVMDLHDLARFLEHEQKVQQNVKQFMPIFHVRRKDPPIVCIYYKDIKVFFKLDHTIHGQHFSTITIFTF